MRHLPRWFVAVAVVATALTFVSVRPAHAACVIFSQFNPTGSNVTSSTNTVAGHSYTYVSTGANPAIIQYPNWLITGPTPVTIYPNSTATVTDDSADCGGPVTWFHPGDGRLNGEPGDRLVVYCNASATPPNVDVWVVDNGGLGHKLAKLPLSDLTSVVQGKFAKNLGASGVLFAGSDANGNAYAALQGGPYGGTAKGNWLKTFSCKAS